MAERGRQTSGGGGENTDLHGGGGGDTLNSKATMYKGAVLNMTQKHSIFFNSFLCSATTKVSLSYSKKLNTTHLERQNYERTAANSLDCYENNFTVIIQYNLIAINPMTKYYTLVRNGKREGKPGSVC